MHRGRTHTDRRRFIRGGLLAGAGMIGNRVLGAPQPPSSHEHHHGEPAEEPAAERTVSVPDVETRAAVRAPASRRA